MPEQARSGSAVQRWSQPSRDELKPSWTTWLPAGFVVFSLLALLLAPLLLNDRAERLRQDTVTPAQEARGAANELLHSFSRAEAALRGLLLTREARFLDLLAEAQIEEERAFARLQPLAERLGPDLAERVAALRASARRANAARDTLVGRALAGDPPRSLLSPEEERHDRLLAGAAALRADIVARLEGARAEIRRLDRVGSFLTVVLAALALASSLLVMRIGRRFRRRALEEAELRSAALALTEAMEVEEVLRRIAALSAGMGRDSSSYVERIDREAGDVEIVASAGEGAPPVGARVPYPGSLTEEAIAAGQPEVLADLPHGERPVAALLREACGDCAALILPLVADESPEGALVILRRRGRSFSPADVAPKRVLAVLAALALRKTALLEDAQRQQHALARATRSRERLIRGVSHDVKNPLGAADGNAQLLEQGIFGELTERQRESIGRIRSSLATAFELIEDLTELARAEAGQLEIGRVEVDAAEVAREVIREYGAAADAAGLTLEDDVPDSLPVHTDALRVRQVLGNLVSNALKYTPRGGRVRLTGALRGGRRSADPGRWLTLAVQDTGPGIPEEEQERLFREFERLGAAAAPGVGLGLAISQRIAQLLGGEITVESEEGRGSTFTLWLPAEEVSAG